MHQQHVHCLINIWVANNSVRLGFVCNNEGFQVPYCSNDHILVLKVSCLSSVLSVSLVYIVAGVLINKLYRNGTGRELIPNVTFWSLLPGLIKVRQWNRTRTDS